MSWVQAPTLAAAGHAYDNGERVLTIVSSPHDGSLWYSNFVWRDATFAWNLSRHVRDGFFRVPADMVVPADTVLFSPGENDVYIWEGE